MPWALILLTLGLVLLIKSADWLVDGSVNLAERFGISPIVIGLTIVAMGTSAPEAAAKEAGIEYELEKVTQINDIMKMGVMVTPALAIDGEVKVSGKVASPDDIKAMLS